MLENIVKGILQSQGPLNKSKHRFSHRVLGEKQTRTFTATGLISLPSVLFKQKKRENHDDRKMETS